MYQLGLLGNTYGPFETQPDSTQLSRNLYVGFECALYSPTQIDSFDASITLPTDVTITDLDLTYTSHEHPVLINGVQVIKPAGLVLCSIHDGTSMIMAPIVIYGNLPHLARHITMPARHFRSLFINVQSHSQGGAFEIQMQGRG